MATSKKTQDELVKELFTKVQARKEAIGKAEKPNWETNCSFGYSPGNANDRINIATVTDTRKLVEIYSFLLGKQEHFDKANAALGLNGKFTWQNFSIEEWKNDLQVRVDQLVLQTKKAELNELERKLDALISPELKREMELATIAALLDGE